MRGDWIETRWPFYMPVIVTRGAKLWPVALPLGAIVCRLHRVQVCTGGGTRPCEHGIVARSRLETGIMGILLLVGVWYRTG